MHTHAIRAGLRGRQFDRFRELLAAVLPGNRFYAEKFRAAGLSVADLRTPADLARVPFTTKADLAADQNACPPYGTVLTHPSETYTRLHQTSGTSTGRPLRWPDTPVNWEFLLNCWQISFPAMGLTRSDRLFFPFSFGPFLGFWTAFEAAARSGFAVFPGGGMTSTARLRFLLDHGVTVAFATPTYALHLAEVAAAEGIDLPGSAVRTVIVAGEPGGGISATRERIAAGWGARVLDHYGMTEVGPVAVEPVADPGTMVVLESDYIAEVLEPNGEREAEPGAFGELVLTNLGRSGTPAIRYRTGDLVRVAETWKSVPGLPDEWLRLAGGVVGRADDMLHVRGNNLYPSAIEAILRRFADVAEYRIVVDQSGPLADLRVEVEPAANADAGLAEAVGRAVRDELLFRIEVVAVPSGSLPRFEMKARRVVKLQQQSKK